MNTNNQIIEKHLTEDDGNRISQVTVFSHQAQVKRQFTVNAEAGINRFNVQLTAFKIDPDSPQAQVFGKGEILGVRYLQIPVKDIPQEKLRELHDEKRNLSRKKQSLLWRRDSLQKQARFLDALSEFSKVEIPREIKTEFPPIDRFQELVDFLDSQYNSLGEREQQLTDQIEDMDREISAVDRHLKSLHKSTANNFQVLEILFNASEAQEIAVEVSYNAHYASWLPFYKIDIPNDCNSVDLTLFSRIQQKTGEDWRDVKLSLSNALPVTGTELPDLNSWYLCPPVIPAAIPMAVAAQEGAVMGSADGGTEPIEEFDDLEGAGDFEILAEQEPAAEYVKAAQTELPVAFEYDVPQHYSIESGDQNNLIPLGTSRLEGEFFHYVVPLADPLAYLVCKTAGDRSLMAARLNIHFGGRFIGSTRLAEKKPGEDLLLNLGPQRGIKVSRTKKVDSVTETFFGMVDRNSVARELQIRISVENLKGSSERIQVVDRLPVSTTDRFQVKGIELKPEPTNRDWKQRKGVMMWEMNVDAGQTKEILINFFVKHPKDQTPVGL